MRTIFSLMLLSLLSLTLASCADTQESAQSCSVQLDNQNYATVAANTNCTNYERGSAYLGQAGVSFGNFLKTGATDNLTETLGISKLSSAIDYTTGNRGYVTSAMCLIGSNTIVTSSRCNGSSRTRSTDELEISMFANIADLIYLNYGVLDTDSNGTVSSTETDNFTSLNTTGVSSSGGGTALSAYSRYEVITASSTYISNSDLSKCHTYTDNYTVDPSTGPTDCRTLLASITEIRPIIKLDSMTDITDNGSLTSRINMVSELSSISTALDADFTSLGISSTNSLRTSLSAGLSKLDNGATAKDNATCIAVTAFDVMYLLVQNPADNSTSSTDLKSKNLLSLTDLTSSVDSSLNTAAAAALSSLTMTTARLVYATDSPATTYTDSYEKAESSLYTAMNNVRSLGVEASVKGDGKVSFRELICIAEN